MMADLMAQRAPQGVPDPAAGTPVQPQHAAAPGPPEDPLSGVPPWSAPRTTGARRGPCRSGPGFELR